MQFVRIHTAVVLIYLSQLSRHNAIVIMTMVQYKYNVRNAYGYTNGGEMEDRP